MNYLFCDLDDTLFQSRRKTPDTPGITIAAHGPDGAPNAFMTAGQRKAFDAMLGAMTLIPVTARDRDAYARVQLPPVPFAIIDHGGIILDASGQPLQAWYERSAEHALAARPWLEELHGEALAFLGGNGLNITSRIIGDFDLPFYWLSKYRDNQEQHLDRMERELIVPWVERRPHQAWIHRNGNNLAVLPRTLQKRHAVYFLLGKLRQDDPTLVSWGMGDSLSDIPFIMECDYMIAPKRSQIATLVAERNA